MRLPGAGFSRWVKQPNRVAHLGPVCGVVIHEVLSRSVSFGCGGGWRLGDASWGLFFARCVSRWGPGAGNNISLRGHPAATTASEATPSGEALAWVVVVGLGFQAIDDSIESP